MEWPEVVEYLLSPTHDVGYRKAAFFAGLGYRRENAAGLIDALLDIALAGEVVETAGHAVGLDACPRKLHSKLAHLLRSPRNAIALFEAIQRSIETTPEPQTIAEIRAEFGLT